MHEREGPLKEVIKEKKQMPMSEKLHKGAPPKNFWFSKENRKNSTKAERVLWTYLRNGKCHGFKFRRQHPISDFIADFYCHECKLIVELDGDYHNTIEQRQYDKGRTYELNEFKIKVVRFTNREVLEDIGFVMDEIGSHLLAISVGEGGRYFDGLPRVWVGAVRRRHHSR